MNDESSASKFSFEDTSSPSRFIRPNISISSHNTPNTSSRTEQDSSNDNLDNNIDASPSYTVNSDRFSTNSNTPSKFGPVSASSSRRSSPKIALTVETSTPNKPHDTSDYISDSSRGEFSFLNTSGAHPDVSNTSFAKHSATPITKPSQLPRTSPHSRNSSISWSVQIPEEWTLERVQLWLELYHFNDSWINTFKAHGLCGERFLQLTSYQILKKYKDELETTNDSTQSRFIHLLRKTLDKSSSITTLSVGSPPSSNSSISSLGSINASPDVSDEIKARKRSSSEAASSLNKLTTTVSTPNFNETQEAVKPQSVTTHQRLSRADSMRRPVSSNESSSKFGWPSSPASPVPNFTRRQHKKSSSSESSLFTSLFSSSTSYLPQTTDEKRQSVSSRDSDSRGLLSKFRKKKEKSGSRESNTRAKDREIVSPISPTTSTTDRHSPLVSNDQSVTARLISDLTTRTTPRTAGDIPFSVHRKFQPIPQNKNSDKYILVTVDNVNFRPINIGQITKKNDFKNKLIETLIPQASNISIHLTDFDCLVGEALDDQTLDDIVNHRFDVSSGKFLVVSTDTLSTLNSSYMTSTSDIQSFDSKETKNPNTPQHYYDTAISKNPGVDYLNFKEYQLDTHATVPRSRKSSREEPVLDQQEKPPPPSQQPSSSGSSTTSQTGTSKSSLSRKKPMHINSSFRVIRPTEKGEINFDKRRESPYSRPSLVAKRSAPPPPKRPSEKLLNIRTDTKPSSKSAWLESVQESVSGEGSYISPYTPSSSNTLIPEPYKGGNSVSPISRKALDATLDDRFEDSQSVQEAHSNVILDTSKGEEEGVSRGFSNRGLSKTFSSRSTAHKFKENFISFDDAPQLEDESEEEEDGSDEDFWAKVPSEAKSGSSTMSEMIVRPAPEVLYDNLEKFFPDADLDRPVIDVSTPPASPLNDLDSQKRQMNQKENEPPKLKRVVSSSHRDADTSLRPQRMKTIRAVAREAGEARKRESIRRNTISQNKPSLVRRQSTKMWGRKVVEVKPNQRQFISKLRKDKDDNISEFSWIKGELIGKGTFGNVYIALNVTTGEMIAVKQVQLPSIPQKNSRVSDVIEALRSEVDTLKDLDHLNIVQYLGFEETERVYNLFLEYVAGGSVASCLRLHGRFDEPLIKFLTSQILGGLAYLHSRGILHRDMKADNLLLDLDGVCKISDFGISKKSNDIYANDAGMSMQGTIFWMAPEVVDSRGEGYSAKVDIWSLGCVVLEMFAGRRPWSNLEAIPAMLKIGKAKAAPPIPEDTLPHVSMEGRSFLDSCFTTNPQERPTAQRLSKDAFCRVDPRFSFANTRLAGLIKTNEKKVIV